MRPIHILATFVPLVMAVRFVKSVRFVKRRNFKTVADQSAVDDGRSQVCPPGTAVTTARQCMDAAVSLGLIFLGEVNERTRPPGCFKNPRGKAFFNNAIGRADSVSTRICEEAQVAFFADWPQCIDGKFNQAFCSEWCNSEKWGCGTARLSGTDPRNLDNITYHCSCDGCNGCPARINQCMDGKFDENFCSEWCNTTSRWGCGTETLGGHDQRNLDNKDYTCRCAGCNGCSDVALVSVDIRFHFEPAFPDSTTCDSGSLLTEAKCAHAARVLSEVMGQPTGVTTSMAEAQGCIMRADEQGWVMSFGPGSPNASMASLPHWPKFTRVCSGVSADMLQFLKSGGEGRLSCESSPPLKHAECLAAATQVLLAGGKRQNLTFHYARENYTLHESVPQGCSIRTSVDSGIYFREIDDPVSMDPVDIGDGYSPVCGTHPWGVSTYDDTFRNAATSMIDTIKEGGTASSNSSSSASSSNDVLAAETCCSQNSYSCNTCGSRRRHTRTASTYCPFWADLACCRFRVVCRQL